MSDQIPNLPQDELLLAAKAMIGPIGSAFIGLVWRRASEIRAGKRLSWPALALDIPCVVGSGIVAGSIALWLGLPVSVTLGLACALSYIGTEALLEKLVPRLIDMVFAKRGGGA